MKEKQKEIPYLSENQEDSNHTTNGVECVTPILEQSDLQIESHNFIDHMEIVDWTYMSAIYKNSGVWTKCYLTQIYIKTKILFLLHLDCWFNIFVEWKIIKTELS